MDYIPFQIVIACVLGNYVAGASEGWEKSVTPVNREWHVEKCSKHAFFPAVEVYPEDEPCFVMKQWQSPQVTLEVLSDVSCFFRLYLSSSSHIITGTVHEAPKLQALCTSQMRKVWDTQINSKGTIFPLWQLCVRCFDFCGGRLDRHGFVSFDEYVQLDYTGAIHHFLSYFQSCFSLSVWIACLGVKGTVWAWEPEITSMLYLLNTTLAVFSRTSNRNGPPC